jgi:glycosyltransferase involved in cell wall biosynthesis
MFVPLPLHDHSVVLTYDYFYPDFSAGGPIASLGNLTQLLRNEMPLRILTSSYHYRKGQFMEGIALDQWTVWQGFPVWYASNAWSIIRTVLGFKKGGRTIFYLNGIFSIRYFLIPLILCVWKGYRIIVSPRGMLQEGAMKKGRTKKQLYIAVVKGSRLLRKVVWHATDTQESADIRQRIGPGAKVFVISNVPVKPVETVSLINKAPGQLHLVYYSLISEKKNLDFFLQLLEHPSLYTVKLDIIGPVKDGSYWRKCQRTISQMKHPDRIRYLGEIPPDKSMELLQQYHGLVLPTLGENFGHAIVEMLSASRPVIISDKTPWNDISVMQGGFALPLQQEKWIPALETMLDWTDQDFKQIADGALLYYRNNFNFEKLKKEYIEMFSNVAS